MIIRNDFNPAECDYIKTNYPITNADRIRAMTDEELAEFFAPRGCPWILKDPCPECRTTCNKCWLDWLKQESTNEST